MTFYPTSRRGTRRGERPPRGAAAPSRTPFPELLAPAGSVESYFAAVSAGADAVYLGLQRFKARERAENFTLADLCRILPHARTLGIRVYLAMNTVLTEADLPEAISILHRVAPLSPDALIVQDLGLMRVLRDFFPGMKFHVSTQAGCASAFAADVFAALGADRVILERHLDLSEVRRIVSASRRALDRIREGGKAEAVAEGRELLQRVIGREKTPGLTGGAAPREGVAGGGTGDVGGRRGAGRGGRGGWGHVAAGATGTQGG